MWISSKNKNLRKFQAGFLFQGTGCSSDVLLLVLWFFMNLKATRLKQQISECLRLWLDMSRGWSLDPGQSVM